jgi:hypothetical protein
MSPLAALIAGLNNHRSELQSAPPDAVRFTDIVYRRLADSNIFAQTVQQLTSRDVQVTCNMQVIYRSSNLHAVVQTSPESCRPQAQWRLKMGRRDQTHLLLSCRVQPATISQR